MIDAVVLFRVIIYIPLRFWLLSLMHIPQIN